MERSAEQNQSSGKALSLAVRLLASGFFVSYLPAALLKGRKCTGAGLLGSLLAFALLPLLPGGETAYLAFLAAFCALAIAISGAAAREYGLHDDPRIVIDEVAGFWTAAALLPRTVPALWTAFILFRIFDTVKPLGIKKLDNMKGGAGIVLDDLAAGLAANVLTRVLLALLAK